MKNWVVLDNKVWWDWVSAKIVDAPSLAIAQPCCMVWLRRHASEVHRMGPRKCNIIPSCFGTSILGSMKNRLFCRITIFQVLRSPATSFLSRLPGIQLRQSSTGSVLFLCFHEPRLLGRFTASLGPGMVLFTVPSLLLLADEGAPVYERINRDDVYHRDRPWGGQGSRSSNALVPPLGYVRVRIPFLPNEIFKTRRGTSEGSAGCICEPLHRFPQVQLPRGGASAFRPYHSGFRFSSVRLSFPIGRSFPFKSASKGRRKEDEAKSVQGRRRRRDGRTCAAKRAPSTISCATCALEEAAGVPWRRAKRRERRSTDECVPRRPRAIQPQHEHQGVAKRGETLAHDLAWQKRVETREETRAASTCCSRTHAW